MVFCRQGTDVHLVLLSPPIPGSGSEQGSHLAYTPRDQLPQHPSQYLISSHGNGSSICPVRGFGKRSLGREVRPELEFTATGGTFLRPLIMLLLLLLLPFCMLPPFDARAVGCTPTAVYCAVIALCMLVPKDGAQSKIEETVPSI